MAPLEWKSSAWTGPFTCMEPLAERSSTWILPSTWRDPLDSTVSACKFPAMRTEPAERNSSTWTSPSKVQAPAMRATSAMRDPWTLALPADLNSCVLTGLPLTTPLPTILIVSSLRVVGHASGVGGRLRDRASNRGPEIDARGCGLFRFLRLVRFGLVAGFDLQVRLFVDLAARESLLELTQDVLAFHSVHRIGLRTAKYVSLWSNISNPFRGIGSIAVGVIVIPFRPRRCRPRRIVAS